MNDTVMVTVETLGRVIETEIPVKTTLKQFREQMDLPNADDWFVTINGKQLSDETFLCDGDFKLTAPVNPKCFLCPAYGVNCTGEPPLPNQIVLPCS